MLRYIKSFIKGIFMFIPSFMFEEEDIPVLRNKGVFLNEYVDKVRDLKYFKINPNSFKILLNILYSNSDWLDEDKNYAEVNLRTVAIIFTNIINKNTSNTEILNCILSYYQINKQNASKLLELL